MFSKAASLRVFITGCLLVSTLLLINGFALAQDDPRPDAKDKIQELIDSISEHTERIDLAIGAGRRQAISDALTGIRDEIGNVQAVDYDVLNNFINAIEDARNSENLTPDNYLAILETFDGLRGILGGRNILNIITGYAFTKLLDWAFSFSFESLGSLTEYANSQDIHGDLYEQNNHPNFHTLRGAAEFSGINKSQFSRFLKSHVGVAVHTLEDLSKKQAKRISVAIDCLAKGSVPWRIALLIDSTIQSRSSLHADNVKRFNHGQGFVIGHQWTNIVLMINQMIIPLPPIAFHSKKYCRQNGLAYKRVLKRSV